MSIDPALAKRLYLRARAERWRVPLERFAEALDRGAERGANLETLHLDDLALACGCAAGDEEAWEHFIREQRPTLYRAADALDPQGGARDLADSIYGELFERSLFRYFHGRSSLATWLRAVLAQRHVDRLRAGQRLEPLPDDEFVASGGPAKAGPDEAGPDENRCQQLIRDALTCAVAELPPRERLRLACYYAQELTLAETGTLLGEHEATCSRHLARTRKTLRGEIERQLREQHALSAAEIAACFGAVSQDPGELDLRQLLHIESTSTEGAARNRDDRKESRPDRSTVRGRT
ncbi:MAG TPA: sigma-70 family RNA polymerase sigma factor [Vicinamibacterales bacterium]|nr:sigma-70 family RNA polymerase sigma factor [Vicinamibacterales bacterium]